MTLEEMVKNFKQKYICVKNCKKDTNNLILSADIVKVYDTLELAKDNASEIRRFMKKYSDFDIVYGDLEDYIATRKNKHVSYHVIDNKKICTQDEIDFIIGQLKKD